MAGHDHSFEPGQVFFKGREIFLAVVREQGPAHLHHLGEGGVERRLAVGRQADKERTLVAVVALTLHQPFLLQPFDHASQRALGDQRFFAQFLIRHARRVAQRGDDVELRMRQTAAARLFAGKPFKALHALGQQPDTFQISFTHRP